MNYSIHKEAMLDYWTRKSNNEDLHVAA